ncbi:hypothetical protein ACJJTC_011142 [Scirpophaga incertulas]
MSMEPDELGARQFHEWCAVIIKCSDASVCVGPRLEPRCAGARQAYQVCNLMRISHYRKNQEIHKSSEVPALRTGVGRPVVGSEFAAKSCGRAWAPGRPLRRT